MQRARVLEEAVQEDRTVRREIHRIVKVFAEEIMQKHQSRRTGNSKSISEFAETDSHGWSVGGRSPAN